MSQPRLAPCHTASPFHLDNHDIYCRWRDAKLEFYPHNINDLLVEIDDPRKLSNAEFAAMHQRCKKTNMVVYISNTGTDPDPAIPLALARSFGVNGLNKNWLADDNGLTSLKVITEGIRQHYIPYTSRTINWHTDGYYNIGREQVSSLLLHSVQRAASGGENTLMDPEIAYIMLREQNPDFIRALMNPHTMTIPARIEDGRIARQEESGPVFSVTASGDLHMRYTIRTNNVFWAEDRVSQQALDFLSETLASDSPFIYRGLLEPGMGLVSNNVLHDRSAFTEDDAHTRHLYRARYYDRLVGTSVFD